MFAKVLKIVGILALCGLFLFGAVEIWLYRNQEKLFRKAQEMVNENLNGNLEIGDFRFRPFTGGFGFNFTLAHVKITDSLFREHNAPFLEAELIHVLLDLNGIYKGDIKIKNLVLQNGGVKMFVRKDGYSNMSIFKSEDKEKDEKKKGDKDGLIKRFGNLRFINFSVSYVDSITTKRYGAVFHDVTSQTILTDSTTNASFQGATFFNGLVFKPEKGGFLMNQETNLKLQLGYDTDEKTLKIYPSLLETSKKDQIWITGLFDFADSIKVFQLNFEAKKIAVDNATPLLPRHVRSQIDSIGIHALVDTHVKVKGQLSPRKPKVDVHFVTDTFQYNLPVGVLRKVVAEGYYTNKADTMKESGPTNARLTASDIHGFFETIPFKIKLMVNNFKDPVAVLEGKVDADSTNLGQLLDPSRYRFKNGKANITFQFNGSLNKFYDPVKDRFNGRLSGKISLKNISMDYLPRQVHLRNIKGELAFDEKAFVFPDLTFNDGQNDMFLKGKVMDLVPYLFGSPKPLRATVNLNIPSWKLNWLETLLAPRVRATPRGKNKLKLSELLDDAIDKIEIIAKLNADQLSYKRFAATNVKGKFTVKDNSMRIEYFQMKAFKGANVVVSGEMDNSGASPFPYFSVRGKISNADVQTVFYSFNNFGQQAITDKNLKGKLSADFNFGSNLNNNVKLIPSSMKGMLTFNLRNGYINNFEPFLKMKKLIFKNRNFESVRFAPISNTFRLSGEEIEIEPMEIESNVMTLFVDGVYSFAQKTDINIEIPLSNLKKRDSTYVLDPNNPDRKEGSKIFLKAIDENGEVNIKLAFRKKDRRKEKEKEK
jgi:hypothetical protein